MLYRLLFTFLSFGVIITACDGLDLDDKDDIEISVEFEYQPENPVAGDEVTLDGTGTEITGNGDSEWTWTLASPEGSEAELENPSAETTSFLTDVDGSYDVTLNVTANGVEESASESIFVGEGEPEELGNAFVLSEGQFGNSNADITFYFAEAQESVNQYYEEHNGTPIGDVGQSMSLIGDEVYIVANNSHRIHVAEETALDQIASIEIQDEASPRYIAGIEGEQALVTNLNSEFLAVVDLASHEQTGTLELGTSSEEIAAYGDYALIRTDIWGNNEVVVYNWQDETIEETLSFDGTPDGMKAGGDAETAWVWVSDSDYLSEREIATGDEVQRIDLPESVSDIAFNEEEELIYGVSVSGIMKIDTANGEVAEADYIEHEGLSFVGYDYATQGYLLAGETADYETRDDVIVFDLEGEQIDSFQAGYAPRGFHFSDQ